MPSWKKIIISGSDAALQSLTVTNGITANSFKTPTGTSTQFLMADGSVSTLTIPSTGTGTTNYIPKFNPDGTIGNSLIYDDGTSVGIGLTSSTSRLEINPLENQTALKISNYSVTGSNNQSALDISGTWNTTGTPALIRANVTDIASNTNSLLMDLQVGGSSMFRFGKNGSLIPTNAAVGAIFGKMSYTSFEGRNLVVTGQTGGGAGDWLASLGGLSVNTMSGNYNFNRFANYFTQSGSGTGQVNIVSILPTINQPSGTNITRGLLINPTLTAVTDWRSIENTIGNNLLNSTSGNTYIGLPTNTGTAKLHVRSSGATSATTALRVENSTPTTLLTVQDNGQFTYNTPTMSLETTSSAYNINLNVSQSALVGAQVYGVNLTPTFFATTGSQTQTALRVNAVFTGSAAATSGSNIIADFGSTSAGSQLTVTDVTSGSIYMVNDVSGLPIIEATSDWTVNMYDFPNRVFRKTGNVLELGVQNNTGSAVNLFADTILNEGLGFTHRTTQASGSTVGAVTSSIWNINFSSVSSSVYVNATVTGFDTGSRDTITGDIKATIRYRAGVATIVGTNQTFINSDNAEVSFNIVAGGTSGSLQVYGSSSTTYQWGATVITQVI